jgi:hypothetical protein
VSARQRYLDAAHAMQSGVAMMMKYDPDEASPKHLRVGVNSAMVESAVLARLLIEKGILTEDEFSERLATQMAVEADLYEQRLSELLGARVWLA